MGNKTFIISVLVLLLFPVITPEDAKPDKDAVLGISTEKPGGTSKGETEGEAFADLTAERNLSDPECHSCHPESESRENLFTEPAFMKFFESFEDNIEADGDGCLKSSYWKAEAQLPDTFKGTQMEHQPCRPLAKNISHMCATYKKVDCIKLTNLLCDETSRTCQRGVTTPNPNGLTALTDVDEFGCSNKYGTRDDIPLKFIGRATYRRNCSVFSNSEAEKCRMFTVAPKYKDDIGSAEDQALCVKPTHLFCDPVMQICLCGQGHDEIRFQFHVAHKKCYIRPTFDVLESYECSPGTVPHNLTVGNVNYMICRCDANPTQFDSNNPSWWRCQSVKLHYQQPKSIVLITTFIYLVSLKLGIP